MAGLDVTMGSSRSFGLAPPAEALAGPELEAAFFEYYPRVVAVLDRLLGDRASAEEIAVDTFLKLAAQREPMDQIRNLGGWLYRTATRLGIDWIRAAGRRRRYERLAACESRPSETPLDHMLRAERVRSVRAALAKLRPFEAQILVLRSQGLSYAELAQALEIKPTSVGTYLARAQAAFEKAYRRAQAGRTP